MNKVLFVIFLSVLSLSVLADDQINKKIRTMTFNKSEDFVRCVSVCENPADKDCEAVCEVK